MPDAEIFDLIDIFAKTLGEDVACISAFADESSTNTAIAEESRGHAAAAPTIGREQG